MREKLLEGMLRPLVIYLGQTGLLASCRAKLSIPVTYDTENGQCGAASDGCSVGWFILYSEIIPEAGLAPSAWAVRAV